MSMKCLARWCLCVSVELYVLQKCLNLYSLWPDLDLLEGVNKRLEEVHLQRS